MFDFLKLLGIRPHAWKEDNESTLCWWYFVVEGRTVLVIRLSSSGYKIAPSKYTLEDARERPWQIWNDPECERLWL